MRGSKIGCGEDVISGAREAAGAGEYESVSRYISCGNCGRRRGGDVGVRGIACGIGRANAIIERYAEKGRVVDEVGDAGGNSADERIGKIVGGAFNEEVDFVGRAVVPSEINPRGGDEFCNQAGRGGGDRRAGIGIIQFDCIESASGIQKVADTAGAADGVKDKRVLAEDKSAGRDAEGVKPVVAAVRADGKTAGTWLRRRRRIAAGSVGIDSRFWSAPGIRASDTRAKGQVVCGQ